MGHEATFALMSYGQTWKNHRRAFWQQLNPTTVAKYQGLQREMAYRLLNTLHKRPNEPERGLHK